MSDEASQSSHADAGPVERHVVRPVPERAEVGAPTVEDAYDMGAKGGPNHDGERLAFEAWMRGHCWALCATWRGTHYRADDEVNGNVNLLAMRTRELWAAWRDRAALARG